MIPRNLPKLTSDAVKAGWDVSVAQHFKHMFAVAARFERPGTWVVLTWNTEGENPYLEWSEINGTPTPYRQCVALLKNPEGAPE